MKIEMNPEETPKSTAMERITAAAEAGGAKRREKIMKTLDRVLGAPEAAGMALTIVGETVDDYKERVKNRTVEIADSLVGRASEAYDRAEARITETRDKAVAKAKDWGNRAVNFGLTNAVWLEDKIVAVCEIPAGLTEQKAGRFEEKAEEAGELLDQATQNQLAREVGLDERQMAALRAFLDRQAVQTKRLEARGERTRERLRGRIDAAGEKANELRVGAARQREGIEKKRIFRTALEKKWLARIS